MAVSSGVRSALTAVVKALSLEVVQDNVTINNLLPERIDSGRQIQTAYIAMEQDGVTFEEARRRQIASIAAKRLGRPEEIGAACAFLCSAQAGYISGQNLHLDGGSLPGVGLAAARPVVQIDPPPPAANVPCVTGAMCSGAGPRRERRMRPSSQVAKAESVKLTLIISTAMTMSAGM